MTRALAARVATVRFRLGLSQRRFAARVGVSRNVVSRWEGGKHGIRAAKLDRIAKVGGVTVDWLLHGDRRPLKEPMGWDETVRLLRAAWREPSRRESCAGCCGRWGDGRVPSSKQGEQA